MKKTLFIIDGSSCIYRAYHAIPRLTTGRGMPTNAIYGFLQTLKKIIKTHSPDYIAVAFDVKGPSFRHALFEEYKIERPPMPDDLSVQIPYIKKIVKAFNIVSLEREGYEADDIIATLVDKLEKEGFKVVIVTGDKDMLQLVKDGSVVVFDHAKEKELGEKEVMEKFGVPSYLIADLIGLAGDSSDGIPGVSGIGIKTAARLLERFGSMEAIFNNMEKVSPEKLRKTLLENKDAAFLSKKLAILKTDVPFEVEAEMLKSCAMDYEALEDILRELGFAKSVKELIPARKTLREATRILSEEGLRRMVLDGFTGEGGEGEISIALELEGGPLAGALSGVCLSKEGLGLHYIAVGKEAVSEDAVLRHIKGIMEDESLRKATDDAKSLFTYFAGKGITPKGVGMDVGIASYLLDPTRSSHTLSDIAYHYLGQRIDDEEDACGRAEIVLKLSPLLGEKMRKEGLIKLFSDIEMPLTEVLSRMEREGVKIDAERLRKLSEEIELKLKALEAALFAAAGERFNINSPKQLSELLFVKLGLKPLKKTKTGYSTDESVLSELSKVHEIPLDIINYRQLSKLKSTYVDRLPNLIDPRSGRIHTTLNQTVTATGRLSSSAPNLQNIPVRGEYGAKIRGAFIAEKGFKIVSADYSQIELRLVAHFSEDPLLLEAFKNDEDIHAQTASEVFGVDKTLVSPEMRRRAKAINFGIIYGMGAQGLSEELGISVSDAKLYIDTYFSHYRRVREFIETAVEAAKKKGYSETLFGRRRYIAELHSQSVQFLRLGERMAVNTPIQGSAADMIKKAMIDISRRFKKEGFSSAMILQIHDELIFEVPEIELPAVVDIVREEMEGVLKLKVPIKVNIGTGNNWQEAG